MFNVSALSVTLSGCITLCVLLFLLILFLLLHPDDGHRGDRNMSVNNM